MASSVFVFAGDWHGNQPWARHALNNLIPKGATVYHVGDFGVWPGRMGELYLAGVNEHAKKNRQRLRIVPGNHEDYPQIHAMPFDDDGWYRDPMFPRLQFAPRGHTWIDRDVRMAALGGAGSVDRNMRVPGRSWWAEEAISLTDVDTLVGNVAARGWDRVDVLVTHEAPDGVPMVSSFSRLSPDIEQYCNRQRVLLRHATDAVGPKWLVHGHWHRDTQNVLHGVRPDETDYSVRVVGLDMDGTAGNLWHVNRDDLSDPLPIG